MSTKQTAQKHAAKRNARAKAKRVSIARGNAAPSALLKKSLARKFGGGPENINFDKVLESAVRDIKKGKQEEPSFNSFAESVEGLRKVVGEVFKLYCYITLAAELIKQQAIVHELNIDLDGITRDLIGFDTRIGTLMYMAKLSDEEREPGAGEVEMLEIGTALANISDSLYNEITRLEPHSVVIEETISRLAIEVEGTDDNTKRMQVIQSIAYKYMVALNLADKESEEHPVPEVDEVV